MSQTWTNNDEGAGGTTAKQGFINLEAKLDSVRSSFSGTAFPTDSDRAVGQPCWRTDGGAPQGVGLYVLKTKDADPNNDVWTFCASEISAYFQTLLTAATASALRTLLGTGTVATLDTGTSGGNVPTNTQAASLYCSRAQNLSDLASAATARTNLGLGALAVLSTVGTSQLQAGSVTGSIIPDDSIAAAKLMAEARNTWTLQTKSTTYTAVAGEFVVATLGSSWTLTLPASPTTGDRVGVYVDGVTGSSALTVSGGAKNIGQQGTSFVLYVPGDTVTLVYNGAKWVVLSTQVAPHSASATGAGLALDTSLSDNAGLVDLANNRITIRRSGVVKINAVFSYASAGSNRHNAINVNAVQVGDGVLCGAIAYQTSTASVIVAVSSGDHITLAGPASPTYNTLSVEEVVGGI